MLACGGFEGNKEMLAKYVSSKTHELPLVAPGLKYNEGAGLSMALEVGADTAGSFDGIHAWISIYLQYSTFRILQSFHNHLLIGFRKCMYFKESIIVSRDYCCIARYPPALALCPNNRPN